MTLELIRLQYLPDRTLGTLHIVGNDKWHCDTLELPATVNGAANVPNRCCIPAGTYKLKVTWSPAFKRWLPMLMAVPGRSGIRIHAGNKPRHTKGCILVGWSYNNELLCSHQKLMELTDQLRRNETHYITIH